MLIFVVHLHVKPEFIDRFKTLTLENARASVQEPDILRFDVVQQNGDPTRFVLWEVYRTPEGQGKHRETAHYQKWRDGVPDMLASPRSSAAYANVFPADEGWG